MYPIRPVLVKLPKGKFQTITFAENQPQYRALPVILNGDHVISRWQLTFKERLVFLFRGYFYITQKNFGEDLQPILPSIDEPKLLP